VFFYIRLRREQTKRNRFQSERTHRAVTFDAAKHKIALSVKSDYYSVFITVNNASESITQHHKRALLMAASVLRRDINITNQSVSLKRAYTHYYMHSLESSHYRIASTSGARAHIYVTQHTHSRCANRDLFECCARLVSYY
jgi:hypothetical protein